MKNRSVYYLTLTISVSFYLFFTGCSKKEMYDANNELSDLKSQSASVLVQEGKLVFGSLNDLVSFSDSLSSLSEMDYLSFLDKTSKFHSYKRAYWNVIDQIADAKSETKVFDLIKQNSNLVLFLESDTSVNEVFPTTNLSLVVDVNGQVIVGDSVGVLTSDSFILLSKAEFAKMGNVREKNQGKIDQGNQVFSFHQIPTEHIYDNKASKNNLLMGGDPSIPYAGITNFPSSVPNPGWSGTMTFYNKTFYNGIRRVKVEFQNVSINTTSYRVSLTSTSYKRSLYVWHTTTHDHHFDIKDLSTGEPGSYVVKKDTKSQTWMFGGVNGINSGIRFSMSAKVWTDYVHEHQGLNGSNQ